MNFVGTKNYTHPILKTIFMKDNNKFSDGNYEINIFEKYRYIFGLKDYIKMHKKS